MEVIRGRIVGIEATMTRYVFVGLSARLRQVTAAEVRMVPTCWPKPVHCRPKEVL